MATIVDCNGVSFKGIKNPYTGTPIDVKMVIADDGKVWYFAPDTYTTSDPQGSVAKAIELWSRVDGVTGRRDPAEAIKCAYTGEVLVPQEDGSLLGGFDPTIFHTREDFLRLVNMRDGISTAKVSSARVETVLEKAPTPVSREPEYISGALEEAEDIIKKSGVKFKKRSTIVAGTDLKKTKSGKRN